MLARLLLLVVVEFLLLHANGAESLFFGDESAAVSDGVDGSGVLVENVDGLERQSLGLGNAEVGEDEATNASRSPDEEHLDTEVSVAMAGVDEVGSGIANTEVPEPVGGGGHRHSLGTDVEREDLASDDPSDWSPSSSEEGDVDADEGDEDLLSGQVGVRDGNTDDSDDVLAEEHTSGTDEEERTTASTVNEPDTRNSHTDVDDVGGNGDQERILNTRALEEGRAVVEDEVDTSELLPSLKEDTGQDTEQDLVVSVLEAVEVRRFAQFLLSAQVGTDFVEFNGNFGVVGGSRDETSESVGSIFITVTLDQVTRRLGEETHATSEDGSPDELDTSGDAPCRVVSAALSGVVDDGSEEETDGNGPLVARDDGTTDPLGRAFRLVHGDQARDHSDTETGEDTTDDEEGNSLSTHLEGNTEGEDQACRDDTPLAAEEVTHGSSQESTEESTSGKNGDDEGFRGGRDGVCAGTIVVTESPQPGFHNLDTTDNTSVITEENTTESSESGHKNTRPFVLGSASASDTSACSDWSSGHLVR